MVQSTASVSPAKHTESARIPDTSRMGEMKRRISADLPVIVRQKGFMIGVPVALVAIGGLFFFFRNARMRSFVSSVGSRVSSRFGASHEEMNYDSPSRSEDLINSPPIV